MTFHLAKNPYALLGVSEDASDDEIRSAFHDFVAKEEDGAEIRMAYQVIRNKLARDKYKFLVPTSYLCLPEELGQQTEVTPAEREQLAAELLLLNEWELCKEECD
jgi:DnaJ-class molecular chaperone